MSVAEDLILEAGWFESQLPEVRARGVKTWWPEITPEKSDYSWLEKESSRTRCRIRGRADVYDFVMLDLLGPQSVLSVKQKRIVWSRGGLKWSWHYLTKENHTYKERLKELYSNYLILLDYVVEEKKNLRKFSFLA